MIISNLSTVRMFATVLAVAASSVAIAQGGTVQLPAQNTLAGPAATTTTDAKTKSAYKKATWTNYQTALKGGSTSREIPPTDCPPLPPKDCLDTWDDELTTAAPEK
jgi:DNA-binding transcriptional regulator YdaS (Cro superfamily)